VQQFCFNDSHFHPYIPNIIISPLNRIMALCRFNKKRNILED
jgi:hypothetical protein